MEADLPATSSQFSLSISMYILVQGIFPLVWSAVSEVKGRKVLHNVGSLILQSEFSFFFFVDCLR